MLAEFHQRLSFYFDLGCRCDICMHRSVQPSQKCSDSFRIVRGASASW